MSYNVPFNVTVFVTSSNQLHSLAQAGSQAVSAVEIQPTSAGSGSGGTSTSGRRGTAQQWPQLQRVAHSGPDTATPNSIINAQTKDSSKNRAGIPPLSPFANAAISVPIDAGSRPGMVDRYAPPDPLPTAPILKDRPPTVPTPKQV